jgi:phenylalanine-4-hydroxylase
MKPNLIEFREFTLDEHTTWRRLFQGQAPKRTLQLHDIFITGLEELNITDQKIPDLDEVNSRLQKRTGFVGVPVNGLEGPENFFRMLANRKFPIGNFIRDAKDLSYTPAPDVFHDLYGHMPFLADKRYADFCQELASKAVKYLQYPTAVRQFERLFWFSIEFALIETKKGRRIFGAGIASSFRECEFALSDRPKVMPFDIETIRFQEFKIDELQKRLFVLRDLDQLYTCLDYFELEFLFH